jgi:hypothetical protein
MKKHPALWIALYALVIWPHLLVAYVLLLRLPESFAGALLTYVGGLALGPLGFFFWHRRGQAQDIPAVVPAASTPQQEGE